MEEHRTALKTQALISRFARGLEARGYAPAFVTALVREHAPLFRLLAEADTGELFREKPSPGRWRANLPAAFSGAAPDAAAEKLAVLHAAREILFEPWAEREPRPKEAAAGEKTIPRAEESLRLPAAAALRARLRELNEDPAVTQREKEREALFANGEPATAALVRARIRFLQKAFRVRLPNAAAAAEQIPALALDALARTGSAEAVYLLEALSAQGTKGKHYVFAVAYCHCLQPKYYPVFNGRVQTALCTLRERAGFYPFLNENLRDYESYLKVLSIFAESCGVAGTPLPDLARYLEDLGERMENQPSAQ